MNDAARAVLALLVDQVVPNTDTTSFERHLESPQQMNRTTYSALCMLLLDNKARTMMGHKAVILTKEIRAEIKQLMKNSSLLFVNGSGIVKKNDNPVRPAVEVASTTIVSPVKTPDPAPAPNPADVISKVMDCSKHTDTKPVVAAPPVETVSKQKGPVPHTEASTVPKPAPTAKAAAQTQQKQQPAKQERSQQQQKQPQAQAKPKPQVKHEAHTSHMAEAVVTTIVERIRLIDQADYAECLRRDRDLHKPGNMSHSTAKALVAAVRKLHNVKGPHDMGEEMIKQSMIKLLGESPWEPSKDYTTFHSKYRKQEGSLASGNSIVTTTSDSTVEPVATQEATDVSEIATAVEIPPNSTIDTCDITVEH
jgi:outer membrane biosynthesis protein TonB